MNQSNTHKIPKTTEEQPAFLATAHDDFTPAIQAVRKAFTPYLTRWRALAVEFNLVLSHFIEESDTLPFWATLATAYPILRPQLNRLSFTLHNPDIDMTHEILAFAQLLAAIDLHTQGAETLRHVIASAAFQQSTTDFYVRLRLDPERFPLHQVHEAMQCHHVGDYPGANRLLSAIASNLLAEFVNKSYAHLSHADKTNPLDRLRLLCVPVESPTTVTETHSSQQILRLYAILLALQTVFNMVY